MLVTYEELWRHLRLVGDPPASDEQARGDAVAGTVKILVGAAHRMIENRTCRTLFPVGGIPADAPENALEAADDIRLALLLLVAHWYEHREAVAMASSGNAAVTLPLAFDALIGPYRWINVG